MSGGRQTLRYTTPAHAAGSPSSSTAASRCAGADGPRRPDGYSDRMDVVVDRRFFAAGAALGARGDRVLGFVDRLIADASRGGMNLERIERSADAKFCSLRVDQDLRAIGLESGNRLVLLYVGHHDDAYRWARTHRTIHAAHGVSVIEIPDAGEAVPDAEPCELAGTCDLPAEAGD